MVENIEIGNRLKLLRKSYGFTQKQVADYLEISQGQMSKLEQGSRTLKVSLLEMLCELYNVVDDWIVYGGDEIPHKMLKLCFIDE